MFSNRAVSSQAHAPIHAASSTSAAAEGGRQLLDAVRRQDIRAVRQIVQRDPVSVHYQDTNGDTPLHLAIVNGTDLALVDLLLDARADPAIANRDGNTCLHRAFALRPPVPTLPQRLLSARWYGDGIGLGAIARRNADGNTAMDLARGHDNAVVCGYEIPVQAAESALKEWMAAAIVSLRAAVEADDPMAVRQLVARTGWSLDAPLGEAGNILFHALGSSAHRTVVELARIAAEQRRVGVLNATDTTGLLTPLGMIALAGDAHLMQALIDAGADVGQRSVPGHTALHLAAQEGKDACIRLLLLRGADPEARDNDGMTPIMAAACGGHVDIIKALQLAGGNVNGRDKEGRTPMMYAHLHGHTGTALRIGMLGGRADAVDNEGLRVADYVAAGMELKREAGQSTCVLL